MRKLGLVGVAVTLGFVLGCSDYSVAGPEDPHEVQRNLSLTQGGEVVAQGYHCHDEDDPGNGDGDDGPILANGVDCHYVPGGGVDDPPSDGGGGGGGTETIGFLGWVDGSSDRLTQEQVRCPPSPNASLTQRANGYAWCNSRAPTLSQRRILNAAIERIADRGPICKLIANAARYLLDHKPRRFRLYKRGDIPKGIPIKGGVGGRPGIALLEDWLSLLNTTRGERPWLRNLESAIAHEIQHYLWDYKHPTPRNPSWPDYYAPLPYDEGCGGLGEAPR